MNLYDPQGSIGRSSDNLVNTKLIVGDYQMVMIKAYPGMEEGGNKKILFLRKTKKKGNFSSYNCFNEINKIKQISIADPKYFDEF